MASYTPNLNLILPVGTEKVSRQIVNQNNGIIDSAVGNIVAPTVQGVSTLAELKTYLLAVAGSAEARKNVPVQFNLTAAASPFNSGLYTGIMQKETNGAFSVLCHGYNGGVVEVQYASSTWTIMNLTSEITSLNSNLNKAPYKYYSEPTFTDGIATISVNSVKTALGIASISHAVCYLEGTNEQTLRSDYIVGAGITGGNIKIVSANTSKSGTAGVNLLVW